MMRKNNNKKTNIKYSKQDRIFNAINYSILTILLIIIMYPLYFIVIAAISESTDIVVGNVWIVPTAFNLQGFKLLLDNNDIWTGYRNTVFYTVVGTIINLVLTIPAGYALSRRNLYGRGAIVSVFAFTMFFGGGMIPTYMLIKNVGLLDSIWVLMIPGAVSVWNLILAKNFFQSSIPDELIEAGRLDGCDDFGLFFKVVVPISPAIIAVLALYYSVGHWNSYFNALIYMSTRAKFPLQMFLREMLVLTTATTDLMEVSEVASEATKNAETMKYSAIIISCLPMLAVYPLVQKYFVKGVMIGAIKG